MGQRSSGLTSVRWLLHVWLRVAHLEASKKENLLELGMAFREMESEILTSSAAVAGLHFHYPSVTLTQNSLQCDQAFCSFGVFTPSQTFLITLSRAWILEQQISQLRCTHHSDLQAI